MARGQSLYDWCMENGEWGQQLLFEFGDGNNSQQFTDEETGMVKGPMDFTRGSHAKIPWMCKNNHKWVSDILHRTSRKRGCPYCSGQRVSDKNSLKNWCANNTEFGKQLLDEWVGLDEDKNNIKIDEVSYGSGRRVYWRCKEGHEWVSNILNRTHSYTKCPTCSAKDLSTRYSIPESGVNDLYTWCKNNGDFGKRMIEEWVGLDEHGNDIEISNVAFGSHKKVLWKCNKEHIWVAKVLHRTNMRSCCPYCCNKGTSYPEQFIYRALLQIYPNTINRVKFQGVEYDIAIPEENTCIEYSGVNWHEDRFSRDEMKLAMCKSHGVKFIQIYAHNGKVDTEDIFEDNLIIYKVSSNKDLHNQKLVEILEHILKQFEHSISEIDIEKAQTEAFNFMHNIETDTENTEVESLLTPGIQIKPEDF